MHYYAKKYLLLPHQEEKVPPKPFVYEYGGVDYNGQGFHKAESQDEYGVVTGNPISINKLLTIALNYHV